MKEFMDALWGDYNEEKQKLKEMERNSDEYKETLKHIEEIQSMILKTEQLEYDKRKDKINVGITICGILVSLGYGVWQTNKTFKFDGVATVTSTMGRRILNGDLPKLFFKR